MQVAEDECRHYELLRSRLEEMGSHYGAFAAHEALWDSAMATAHSLPARLAVEHAVHEARGCCSSTRHPAHQVYFKLLFARATHEAALSHGWSADWM